MNRLAHETSPYLRQHRDNPVDWYPWGPEAFAAAQARDCPVLLSVGYSSCHWCHVMAHESFEDADVAAVMNERFVNVKVDREERPDVDALYMEAVQALTGRGGWPMTVFLTPTGEPFFGGTYYPRDGFVSLLRAIDDAWHTRREDIASNVAALVEAVARTASIEPATDLPGPELVERAVASLTAAFDPRGGGFGRAPKFPSTTSLELVLRAHVAGAPEPAATIVTTTLDAMASGGIADHLGGGFARYSVDEQWLVPHFEKMLYDQALLLRIYVHAWQVFGHDRWRQVAAEIVEYVQRDLRHPDGGWYSAEDADSPDEHGHGHEGLCYLWTPAQIREVLDSDLAEAAIAWYGVRDAGNFEGATILNRMHARGELARPPEIDQARARLLAARALRPRPGLDDKVLTEWNALFQASLAEAAAAMDRPDWLAAAEANAEFLLRELRGPDGRWRRSWQADGGARHEALAADHAALVDAFTRLGEATGRARWIAEAVRVADELLDRFWDVDQGGLYTVAEDAEQLVVRQKDVFDHATPSANSVAALAWYRLAALTGETRYAHHADRILALLGRVVAGTPLGFTHLLAAVDVRHTGVTEIAVVGERDDLVRAVQRRYLPHAVLAWGEPYPSPLWDDRPSGAAYVCREYTCLAPATTVDELVERLGGK